jgi:hypothetical protein
LKDCICFDFEWLNSPVALQISWYGYWLQRGKEISFSDISFS